MLMCMAALQVLPWILDVGYTLMFVAIMLAVMGHILFGDFEVTMNSLASSVAGSTCTLHALS